MKEALRDPSKEFAYRAREFGRLTEAVVRFQIPIAGRIVLDVGCNHGALTAGLPSLGAREVIGVDVDAGAIKRAKAHEHRREGADCH
jgi:predicted RNA methylase